MSDFRRMKWARPDTNNTVGALNINPRVSIHLAIDNFGRNWLALF